MTTLDADKVTTTTTPPRRLTKGQQLVRIITTRQLRSIRRWMIVGIVTFSAVITPSSDPFSLFFMAVPLYLFYEISIVIGRVMKR